ncbi:hypothetical protein OAA23_00650 [bacterium]|jgi:hypothetical protein|nr:hypothetical protein [bacterium]
MEKQQTKVTEEELQQIAKFQESIQEITLKLGQLALKKLNVEKEEEYLDIEYNKLLQEENQLGDNLKEKYGEAQINLKTGDIIYP